MAEIMHENSIRILCALGLSSSQIEEELEFLDAKEIDKIKKKVKNIYTKKQIISLLNEKSDKEISVIAQIPEYIVCQIREEHQRQEEKFRSLIALGASTNEIMQKVNIRFYYYIL